MNTIKKETLNWAYKPFDVVTNSDKGKLKFGDAMDVGLIREVNVNNCQDEPKHQITYAVNWLILNDRKLVKSAWFDHDELTYHCNLLIEIAKMACHPFGHNKEHVQTLFNAMDRSDMGEE